jgi:hypothetical protein
LNHIRAPKGIPYRFHLSAIRSSVGVGAGAAVLVGGGFKDFSLQPVALEGNIGLGAAAGLGYLYLEPERK